MFKKILIANRGEIAVRIARACRELGIRSAAIYSDVDKNSLHGQRADESYPLGDPRPSESYLNIAKLLQVAGQVGADAIHPGYGFLSENARFAEACRQAGLVFIGPPAAVIRQMGDKIGARNFLKKHGVPIVPGTDQPLQDWQEAARFAKEAGYPVLLKAAAGGGGKGMRIIHQEKELREGLAACQREARKAFGDDRIFVEKYLLSPRHVEIQIVADHHGSVRHLFERECSIQRRHQKVIEESPSPVLDQVLREKMGATAIKIAQLIDYQNVGTIEFILDADKNFYFLEVNTRLQVEHPVTEFVTGIDLVKTQIRIAVGEKLNTALCTTGGTRTPFQTVEVDAAGKGFEVTGPVVPLVPPLMAAGHSIECRIYAEDPSNQFLPSIGTITKLREPMGEGIRVDSGVYAGWQVPVEYDPLLAKLIVHAPTRPAAILKMVRALGDFEMDGIKTNIPFLQDLLRHPEFIEGRIDTGFIERNFSEWTPVSLNSSDPFNPWQGDRGWRLGAPPHPSPLPKGRGRSLLPLGEKARMRGGDHDLTAPMPGKVIKVAVTEGSKVKSGDLVVVMEAMKMEHSIFAPQDGTIKKVRYQEGDQVAMGEKLVEIS